MEYIYHLPIWQSLYAWITLYLSFTIIGFGVFLKITKGKINEDSNEMVLTTFNLAGVIFSLIVTFVWVSLWTTWQEVDANVGREADILATMYSQTHHMPEPYKLNVRKAIKGYTYSVITDEWPAMKKGQQSPKTQQAFMSLRQQVHLLYDLPSDDRYFYEIYFPLYRDLTDLRRMRLHDTKEDLPKSTWYVLFAFSFVTIISSFFYKMDDLRIQFTMKIIIAIMFAMSMFICYDLDKPFVGDSAISNETLQVLYDAQFNISDVDLK